MAKRRSCRRTAEEEMLHDRAVRIRKMTDEQLCRYLDEESQKAFERGMEHGKKSAPVKKSVGEFIAALQISKIPGIGAVTINKLLKVAMDNGYMEQC